VLIKITFQGDLFMVDIYKMELHEREEIKHREGLYMIIIRVPGGWIYEEYHCFNQKMLTSVFVPFNNEFQK
jgi:hypothetical protein